jgi:hypothetical protein
MQLKLNALWHGYLHIWTQPHSSLLSTEIKTALDQISTDMENIIKDECDVET